MIDGSFLKTVKNKLLNLKAQILSRSYQLSNIPDEEKSDLFDLTSVEKIRDVEHIASSLDVETLKLVEHALEKIELGNYGICEFCGIEIDRERLLEIPYVRYCVDCQEKLELEEHVSKIGSELSEVERVSATYDEDIVKMDEETEEKSPEEIAQRVAAASEEEEEEEGEEVEETEAAEEEVVEEEIEEKLGEEVEEEIEEEMRKEEKDFAEEETGEFEEEEEEEGRRGRRGRKRKSIESDEHKGVRAKEMLKDKKIAKKVSEEKSEKKKQKQEKKKEKKGKKDKEKEKAKNKSKS